VSAQHLALFTHEGAAAKLTAVVVVDWCERGCTAQAGDHCQHHLKLLPYR
jgi:hypothetical protein